MCTDKWKPRDNSVTAPYKGKKKKKNQKPREQVKLFTAYLLGILLLAIRTQTLELTATHRSFIEAYAGFPSDTDL